MRKEPPGSLPHRVVGIADFHFVKTSNSTPLSLEKGKGAGRLFREAESALLTADEGKPQVVPHNLN